MFPLRRNPRPGALLPLLAVCLLPALPFGCVQEMADQPRVETLEENPFFEDGLSVRGQVPGTIARGQRWEETPETTGRRDGEHLKRIPIAVDDELLALGRKNYGIFCSHCHGLSGAGDGMVVQRGFPRPPDYHIARLRTAPDGHLFEVVTQGIGRMPRFGRRIEPRGRWAVVAYVRALQLSRNVPADELSAEDRRQLTSPTSD